MKKRLDGQQPLIALPPASRSNDAASFVKQTMYFIAAPYVTWPGEEKIYQANDNKNKALIQRLAHHKEIWETEQCTEFEAMLYISTATLAHPLSHEWFEIYMWLFRRWNPKLADECGFEEVRWTQNHQEDLARLRAWIFKVQMAHLGSPETQVRERLPNKAIARTRSQQGPTLFN